MCVSVVTKHHQVARSRQEAQADDLVDAGAFMAIFHGLDTPFQVFNHGLDDGVVGVVDGVVHHDGLLVDLASEDDSVKRGTFRLDVSDFVIEHGEIWILTHNIYGVEVSGLELALLEIDGGDAVIDVPVRIKAHEVVGVFRTGLLHEIVILSYLAFWATEPHLGNTFVLLVELKVLGIGNGVVGRLQPRA